MFTAYVNQNNKNKNNIKYNTTMTNKVQQQTLFTCNRNTLARQHNKELKKKINLHDFIQNLTIDL